VAIKITEAPEGRNKFEPTLFASSDFFRPSGASVIFAWLVLTADAVGYNLSPLARLQQIFSLRCRCYVEPRDNATVES
jgi:hypothetical protein